MNLYLVRHAEPEIKTYKGFPGPSLGKKGQIQAEAIAAYLKKKNIQQVYTSDYARVKETLKPFQDLFPQMKIKEVKALRERENELESHDSLVHRVHTWFDFNKAELLQSNTAIFSHCGPINMILMYLDPDKMIFDYPYEDTWGCHTPLGQLWDIKFEERAFSGGVTII
jgi:2,3-bisphosphoglycerate-dependent phosphoglycerate mutase